MACELEQAFDKVRSLLPDEWVIAEMVNRSNGWHVTVGKWGQHPLYYQDATWWPRMDTVAGTLTKALNRMAEALENRDQG